MADLFEEGRLGIESRIGGVDAIGPRMSSLEHHPGLDFDGAQGRSRVGREERVARAAGEDDDSALLEVAGRPTPDVRLSDLFHPDGGLHPGRLASLVECVLEGQRIDGGRQHAHVVGLGTVHARAGTRHAPPDVAAADDDRDVDLELATDFDNLLGDLADDLAVDAVPVGAGERLS